MTAVTQSSRSLPSFLNFTRARTASVCVPLLLPELPDDNPNCLRAIWLSSGYGSTETIVLPLGNTVSTFWRRYSSAFMGFFTGQGLPPSPRARRVGSFSFFNTAGSSAYCQLSRSEEHTSELQSRFGISY